ncbi:MAG: NAD(P)-dependent oxidoreductase [Chromatiaceae bacterium]|nr:NAD(P)-dependent oxidoreductase [Chromatiaceae bacterium]
MTTSLFLTGGTGFVGRSLLRHLSGLGEAGKVKITVLSRSPASFLARFPEFSSVSWLRLHQGNVLDQETLPDSRFDTCIHAASDASHVSRANLIGWFDEVVAGTRVLLDWSVRYGLKRFLFLSSGAVYGTQPAGLNAISETILTMPDPIIATNVYGISKRASEHLCALYSVQHGLEVVIARLFSFVGYDLPLKGHLAIGNFIQDALTADAIIVAGDGTPIRTYLDQDDLAHWLITLLEHGRPGVAYNVGSDEVISIGDLAHLVRDLLAPDKPVEILGQADDRQGRNRYIPDIRKAQRELGLTVTIPLAEAIRRTGAAHRGQSLP